MAHGLDDRAARGRAGSPSRCEVRLESVVSTFLVSFGVVVAAIAGVVYVVINAPDQPATIRRQPAPPGPSRRERAAQAGAERRRAAGAAVTAPGPSLPTVPLPATPALALPESDIMRLRVLPAARTTLWVRLRSGVALVVLVAVLGALLALAVGGVALGITLLIRSATG